MWSSTSPLSQFSFWIQGPLPTVSQCFSSGCTSHIERGWIPWKAELPFLSHSGVACTERFFEEASDIVTQDCLPAPTIPHTCRRMKTHQLSRRLCSSAVARAEVEESCCNLFRKKASKPNLRNFDANRDHFHTDLSWGNVSMRPLSALCGPLLSPSYQSSELASLGRTNVKKMTEPSPQAVKTMSWSSAEWCHGLGPELGSGLLEPLCLASLCVSHQRATPPSIVRAPSQRNQCDAL